MIPDNGNFDAASGKFYVAITADANAAAATVKGAIEIIDTKTGQRAGRISVDGTDPAGVAFDAGSARMFVPLGDTAKVTAVDAAPTGDVNFSALSLATNFNNIAPSVSTLNNTTQYQAPGP